MENKISFEEFEGKIDLTDINFLLSSKEEGTNWPMSKTQAIERWYKRFLYLAYVYPNLTVVPTTEVDTYWHHHIMDTEKYYNDCQILFGHILHHDPYLGTEGKKDKLLLYQLFEETNTLFDKHFGERPAKSSDNPMACGGGGKCGRRASPGPVKHIQLPPQ